MSMDPRELWDRNAVLAEAFCLGDERVREAQARLDEAQADRSRVLAAFAVTVGSAGAVAGLFGLNEREVRVARRTVGKDDARAVAEELLAAATPAAAPRESEETPPAPEAAAEYPHQNSSAGTRPTGPARDSGGPGAAEQSWSPAMDAVLIGSWQTGVDLRELAAEFGLDLTRLVTRAQQLSAQGRFYPGPVETHAGRHRRGPGEVHETEYTIPAQQTAAWNSAHSAHPMASAWHTGTMPTAESVPDNMAALASEWDNTLAPWGTLAPSHEDSVASHQPWAQYHLSS
ncbi:MULTISPECIES: hypothetical protein [Streptomyces]|uniref:hypothetical protein n=2 Tax=Streptomyces TaxID=1883 RepID=UPI003424506B